MASAQHIKRRISSVKNTRQITKAMELVSASKLRRAQEAADQPRTYVAAAREVLALLRQATTPDMHGFFRQRPIQTRALVVIAGDSGLAGAFNTNVIKRLVEEIKANAQAGVATKLILVGRQVARFAVRLKEVEVLGVYEEIANNSRPNELRSLITTVFSGFENGSIDAVDIIYTHFKSAVTQTVRTERLLPAGLGDTAPTSQPFDFEPSSEVVLEMTVARLAEAQIYQALLDSQASEHAMRMLAMKNATDNANDLVEDLTLAFNNARQANITQELAEITGGAEAMK